jgi:hypothetical protein
VQSSHLVVPDVIRPDEEPVEGDHELIRHATATIALISSEPVGLSARSSENDMIDGRSASGVSEARSWRGADEEVRVVL